MAVAAAVVAAEGTDENHRSSEYFTGIVALSHFLCGGAQSRKRFRIPRKRFKLFSKPVKATTHGALSLKIFGPDGKDIVESGDPSDDKDNRANFVKAVGQKYKLISDPMNKDKLILSIGKDNWPFPIPLVRQDGRWYFDSAEGRQEMLARRIGSNELNAIEVCHGYVEAQFEYAQVHRPNGAPEYAQKIVSSPGKQDGLYWENPPRARRNARCPKDLPRRPPECRWKSVSRIAATISEY